MIQVLLINYVLIGTCVKWKNIPDVQQEFGLRVSRDEVNSVKACRGKCLVDYPLCHAVVFSSAKGCTVHYAEGRLFPGAKGSYYWKIEGVPCEGMGG